MATETIPLSMRAAISKDKATVVAEIPIPILEDNDILVKVKTAALNPSDLKFFGKPDAIVGCDCAGEIIQIGANINPKVSLQIGDRVVGLVHGGTDLDRGAFCEYAKLYADLVWKIPEDLSYEDAVTFGVGCLTPVQAMFYPDRLGLVGPPDQVKGEHWIFIYGGGTSVGHFAIQWAKIAGYSVVLTSSARNREKVKSLGADFVFDYNDPDVVAKVKQATGDSIHHSFDTFGEESSQVMSVNVLAPGKGHMLVTLPESAKARRLRKDVKVQATYLYSVIGRQWSLGPFTIPPSTVDKSRMTNLFIDVLPRLIKEGKLKPMTVKLWSGGLDDVHDAMQYIAEGKVSAEKMVLKISE